MKISYARVSTGLQIWICRSIDKMNMPVKRYFILPRLKKTRLNSELYSITASINLGQKLRVENKYGYEHSKH